MCAYTYTRIHKSNCFVSSYFFFFLFPSRILILFLSHPLAFAFFFPFTFLVCLCVRACVCVCIVCVLFVYNNRKRTSPTEREEREIVSVPCLSSFDASFSLHRFFPDIYIVYVEKMIHERELVDHSQSRTGEQKMKFKVK